MFKLNLKGNKRVQVSVFLVGLVLFVAVPFMTFSSHKKDLYVNADASGMEDGSKEHPYQKIWSAIDKADTKTAIHVSNGEYEENITLKKGIKLFGEDKDKTIIKAKKDKWATIYMKDDSEIDDITVKGGNQGIFIESHAKVNIINCLVKYNDNDGIVIEGDGTTKSNQVYISKTEVRKNGRAGIYVSGVRRVVIMDSDILDNQTDGIDLARGVSAYLRGNLMRGNGGSGLVATIDGSDIWTKDNGFRNNGQDGLHVSFYGGAGRINISKAKFVDNSGAAVARLQRAGVVNSATWNNSLTFENNNYFATNVLGDISAIKRVN